jgi:hypothetical protein
MLKLSAMGVAIPILTSVRTHTTRTLSDVAQSFITSAMGFGLTVQAAVSMCQQKLSRGITTLAQSASAKRPEKTPFETLGDSWLLCCLA